MSEVILFYINKQELNWIRYAFTFGRSFSSHSTLSIAFKVSWPPTNLPIKSMLKGLTSSFSFVFFFGKLSNSVHKQNKTTVADQGERAGGPAFPLLLDHQTEARRAEKKFFLRPPPPPLPPTLSEGLDPPLNNLQYSSWNVPSCTNEHNNVYQKCYLPNTECFSSKWRQERNVMKLQVNRSHYEFYSEWIRTLYRRG